MLTRILFFFMAWSCAYGQTDPDETLKKLNASIDEAIIKKDIDALLMLYADDFVFTHGTGKVSNKDSWIKAVENPNSIFVKRTHDSVHVELHDDIAILAGKLLITRMDNSREVRYGIWYVRVFRLINKRWQLISHRTTKEWHY